MKLKSINNEFTYENIAHDMWRELLLQTQKEMRINFNDENDEAIDFRTITIKKEKPRSSIDNDFKFKCELRSAAGDWEEQSRYFRCQIIKGITNHYSQYGDSYFIFIPNKKEGNCHLIKNGNHFNTPDADGPKKDIIGPDDQLCWKSLNKYLENIVNEPSKN